jgi:uncharacterized protein with PIN domain
MLRGLGRWLRAAGYDTAIADGGAEDADLLARAAREGRLLLTADRALAARAGRGAVLLSPGSPGSQAAELRAALGIDWLHAPLTRCLLDNAALGPAGAAQLAQVPSRARELGGEVLGCPLCGRVYWPGSHVRRILARLGAWQSA